MRLIIYTSEICTERSDISRQSSRVAISRVSRTSPNSNGQFQVWEIARWWSHDRILTSPAAGGNCLVYLTRGSHLFKDREGFLERLGYVSYIRYKWETKKEKERDKKNREQYDIKKKVFSC